MRRSWMVGAVGLAALVFATTAAAAVVGNSQRMRFETSNGATLGWVTTTNEARNVAGGYPAYKPAANFQLYNMNHDNYFAAPPGPAMKAA